MFGHYPYVRYTFYIFSAVVAGPTWVPERFVLLILVLHSLSG